MNLTGTPAVAVLQPLGSYPPLFVFPGAGTDVMVMRLFAERLGEDQPFCAMRSPVLDGARPLPASMEEHCAHYVRAMREIQPRGPYYLCGPSFGGIHAFETARQLREAGETIALLAMFDTYGKGYPRRRRRLGCCLLYTSDAADE